MNQKTFEELVKDSRLLNKDTLSELEQLLKEYPFCQTFHLLYAKNLYQQKHIRYHQQLKVTSAIAGDRGRLKHYIEDLTDTEIKSTPEQSYAPPSGLEKDTDYESLILSTLDAEISREEKKMAIIALINKKFSERIDLISDNKSTILTEESELVNKPEFDIESTFGEINKSVDNQVDLIESTSSEILIERFLRDTPRISRPTKEFYNPVNLAARSLEENEEFYTETYASICLMQGNAAKAIKIYQKLSLKLPEKSSYFAGLIEKIKKEQNI